MYHPEFVIKTSFLKKEKPPYCIPAGLIAQLTNFKLNTLNMHVGPRILLSQVFLQFYILKT